MADTNAIFQALLGRSAEQDALNYYAGMTPEQVQAAVMASPEYADRTPGIGMVDYGGTQVRNDASYMYDLEQAAKADGMTAMEYDKLHNPDSYGARWGIPAATTAPSMMTPAPATSGASSVSSAPAYTPYNSAAFNFEADPGYAFRKSEGEKALQAKQLASGNFFSGGALKEASDFNSGLASQEYGNAFSRYMSKDASDFRNHQANFSNDFSRWNTLDNKTYDRSWNEDARDYNRWTDDYNRGRDADNTNWGRLQYLDQSGQNAATQTGNFGANSANNIGRYSVYGGDARGDGYINSSNAWNAALGNSLYALRRS